MCNPFDGGKKLSLAECIEKKKVDFFYLFIFFFCLVTAHSISISVSPTKGLRFIIKKK